MPKRDKAHTNKKEKFTQICTISCTVKYSLMTNPTHCNRLRIGYYKTH